MSPLSQAQLGIFYACQNLDEQSGNYQIPALWKLPDDVDIVLLKRALEQSVVNHLYILSRIVLKDDILMMEHESGDYGVESVVEIHEVARIDDVRSTFCRAMDLLHDRLFRIEIYKTEDGNYLYIDFHHIIADGSALNGVLLPEIDRAYRGETLTPEPLSGDDVANMEYELRQSEEWKQQQEWYLKEFGDAAEVDSMPIASSIPLSQEGEDGKPVETIFHLPVAEETIEEVCQKYGVKESVVFTAAWGKMLANYTAEDKAFFTTIYSGRSDVRKRQTMTMMMHTLPVYMHMPSTESIGDWLASVRRQQKATREKDAYSFSDIHQDLNLRGEILFGYHGKVITASTADHLWIDGQNLKGEDLRVAIPNTILGGQLLLHTMTKYENGIGDYDLRISYQSNIYSKEMIEGMADAYAAILNSMATAKTIADLSAASQQQLQWLDGQNPDKLPEYPEDKTVLDLFKKSVEKYPDNECCVFENRRYTYREIDTITDDLANQIHQKLGIQTSQNPQNHHNSQNLSEPPVVSFIVPRSEWMVIVPLAIVKAGCTYQPLDYSYPKERLNFMVHDTEAQLLICAEEFKEAVDEYEGDVLIVQEVQEVQPHNRITSKPYNPLSSHSTALLIYTSGTTGTPKGVMLSHHNLLALVTNNIKVLQMDNTSCMATYASYGFDAYQQDLWTALSAGAALHVLCDEVRFNLVAMHDYFVKEQITHALMTTQVATQMAVNFPDIPCLKVLGMGGEKLTSIDPPHYRLINEYGPTEATVYVTYYDVTKNERNIPIGRPVANAWLYIVNKDMQRVPMGAAGELLATGPQIGKGYLKQPEKTAAAFIDNPFTDGTTDTLKAYRTGDIVRYREDGAIEFVGRKDGQVKVRGFRIELKEVEAVIRDFHSISNATVQAFDLEAGGKAIAAYIVAEEEIDIKELHAFIADQKPPYMVPAVTMQIDEIPLTVNGKVDKKKLPQPTLQNSQNLQTTLNILEEELVEMIGTIAGCRDFGITTPLQYIGLTSISSIKLAAQLYKRFGINISNKEINHDTTVLSIENKILENMFKGPKNQEAQPQNHITPLTSPLSNAQMGVYYECLKNPESTAYNIPTIIHFPDLVTPEQIKDATEQVIKAHPLLLAHFEGDNVFTDNLAVDPVVEITSDSSSISNSSNSFVKPFNLTKGPLYRAVVCGNTLFFDVHHLVMDGSSVSIFIHDICRALQGEGIERETYTFLDYAKEEATADTSAAEDYFTSQLSSVDDATSLPADLHGNEKEGRAGRAYQAVNHAAVEAFAREHGVTPASVYLAAVEYLAARYGNTKDVCICTVSSGRSNMKIADTVGMFVNTLPLVSHITDGSVEDYIYNVADNFRHTLDHENYPFARISDKFGIDAELVFVYEVGVMDNFSVGNHAVTIESLELSAPKFKVTLLVEPHEGQICLSADYNDALYSPDMIRRMLESLNQVIENMIATPKAEITGISIMSPSQQIEMAGMNSIGTAPLPIRLLHQGMERWAEKEPERIAVIATDRTLTYREFNNEANNIAQALIERGLKKGDAVVVLLPRRSTTLTTIFGIMKTGGAFIPCDPEYPTERIRLIAEDSGAPFVVTTADLVGNYGERGVLIDHLLNPVSTVFSVSNAEPTDLAYYIYTSGSTGKPKGVRVAHYNITTLLNSSPQHPIRVMMEDCERIFSVSTISFDASIFEYGMALFNGRTFVFANEEEAKDPLAMMRLIELTHPDYFGCTSSRMLQYMELPDFVVCMKHFKCILQGGEKFSELLLDKIRQINSHCVILNGYGPTEISICSNSIDLQHAEFLTVGKPLPNYTEWVIDRDGNELPVGVTGELLVGGDGVTQGYNNLPELTAEKFITYRGLRAFKTGDFARWLPNGEVMILGRTDNQVKLRGLRIELGEVEKAIAQVEGVRNVLVKICNIQGRDHLSAYYVADQPIDINDMKSAIRQTLTSYMVPTAYLQMDKFPITPNGKVDFRHLPEPLLAQVSSEYVAPANDTEKFFAETFAHILNLDKVSATDSFFDLGGTSLVVMKVVIALQQAGYKITYADVFAHPSPRKLAALISGSSLTSNLSSLTSQDPDADIQNFDYTDINRQLEKNTLESFKHDTHLRPLGDVLLTGATGFLGIHVLKCLVDQYPDTTIHCLLRPKGDIPAEERLKHLLFYYFETNYSELFGRRIFVHEGDVTSPLSDNQIIRLPDNQVISTVINCAAIVKHFSKDTDIEDVNVGGLRNCIDYCLHTGARLIQVSTYSVAGASVNGYPDIDTFNEQMLFCGQQIRNQYIHSKIMGERLLLDAVATRGLDAKIMRVGNLSARSDDGEFQINLNTNNFMGRLRTYSMLCALSYSSYQSPIEFSPIDQCASAICLLSQTNSNCTVFHPYNNHQQMLGDILNEMKTVGKDVKLVEDEDFVHILNKAKADPDKQERLSAMLAYENSETDKVVRIIAPDNNFTIQVLLRLGFRWNTTSQDYIDQFLRQIDGLGFFDE